MSLQRMLGSRCQGVSEEKPEVGLVKSLHPSSSLYCSGLDSLTFHLLLGKPESLGPWGVHVTAWLFSYKRVTFPDAGNTSPRSIPLLMWLRL